MRWVAVFFALLASCREAPRPTDSDSGVVRSNYTQAELLQRTRSQVLMLDAALKHNQDVLQQLVARDAGAVDVAAQRDKVQAVENTLRNEERRLKMLQGGIP